ncbi:MAG: hypothetical protein ABI068_00090 [Ktedonobacterales bacterium]
MTPFAHPVWVVRAGAASVDYLIRGYTEHTRARGVFGFSVQSAAGKTVEELAAAGRFPNAQISYATLDTLQAAVQHLGYRVRLVKTPGTGFHHTLTVLYDANGIMLRTLPRDAAVAISAAFQRMPNPSPAP